MSSSSPRRLSSSPGPVLFVSYSGLWGGAERNLVDIARGLETPVVILCPEGALAARARAAGIPVLTRPARSRELRGGASKRLRAVVELAAHAREVHMVATSICASAVVAFGMRSAIAGAAGLRVVPGAPAFIFEHVDFLPGPESRITRPFRGEARRPRDRALPRRGRRP